MTKPQIFRKGEDLVRVVIQGKPTNFHRKEEESQEDYKARIKAWIAAQTGPWVEITDEYLEETPDVK